MITRVLIDIPEIGDLDLDLPLIVFSTARGISNPSSRPSKLIDIPFADPIHAQPFSRQNTLPGSLCGEHTGRNGYHGDLERFVGIAPDGQSVDEFVDDPIA